jgi:hypothetical protein
MSVDLTDLKSRVVELNKQKNSFVNKKIKLEESDEDKNDIITSLVYVIAEIRKKAHELGVDDSGKITEGSVIPPDFVQLNEDIKGLKTQVMFLVNSSVSDIKAEMTKQKEHYENNKAGNNTRLDDTRQRLRDRLNQ